MIHLDVDSNGKLIYWDDEAPTKSPKEMTDDEISQALDYSVKHWRAGPEMRIAKDLGVSKQRLSASAMILWREGLDDEDRAALQRWVDENA